MSLTTINSDNVFKKGVIGNVRTAQEDSHDMAIMTPNGDVFVVCDGMGGHVGGAKASSIAVDSIIEYFKKEKYDNIPQALNDAIQYANMQIIGFASANPEFRGMGTTACIVILKDNEAYIAHVGDSRIYLYLGKEKQLHRITKDHSYVQNLVDAGQISDDEAEHHPNKNRILKALGIRPDMTPTVDVVHPKNGDIFLICTDGLNGMISDNTILQVMKQDVSLEKKGELLINLAMQGEPGYPGGQDNCTLELINIDNSPWQNSEFTSYNPKKQIDPGTSEEGGKQKPPFPLKKLAFVLIPLLLVIVFLITIPVIKENKNENKLKELNSWIGEQKILDDGDLSPADKENINFKIEDLFGSKDRLDKIYKESKYKETYKNIKIYREYLDTDSKLTDEKLELVSNTSNEESETDKSEETNSSCTRQDKNTGTIKKTFTRDNNNNFPFGVTRIEPIGDMYVIKFKNKTGFYLNKIIELFKIEKSDFMEWNKLNSDKVIADKEYIIKKNKDSFDFELHTVKKGDILNDISNEYQVSINDVEICNGIENTEQIQPNQKLIIITKK
ncbi:MAG: Stp1/IreP family PP2C-type Ser/Thr phosphatase [Alphaproteobacteria bacterium]|nr:Stp1/IreP family PP2C-type Ser/Thr phosphatase [Bacteroidales bacterium]MBQ2883485.1 Stp1/IreP family PP2C-type Ser/Thr phosphatase [Alphaproteobacteria bacterium]